MTAENFNYIIQDGYETPFSWGEFGNAIGDAATGLFENVSGNFDANAANSAAVANINNALADSIREKSQQQKERNKMLITVLFTVVVAVTLVSIFRIVYK